MCASTRFRIVTLWVGGDALRQGSTSMLPRMGISAGSPRLTGLSQAAFCLAVMLFISAKAWPCSCIGIASIEETVSSLPLLVEAEVVSLERTDSPQYGPQVLSATLRVVRVLKGSRIFGNHHNRTVNVLCKFVSRVDEDATHIRPASVRTTERALCDGNVCTLWNGTHQWQAIYLRADQRLSKAVTVLYEVF